jgi:hypothetical protein
MSDDFHRPTLTFPEGAYNATQVRLYGVLPEQQADIPIGTLDMKLGETVVEIAVKEKEGHGAGAKLKVNHIKVDAKNMGAVLIATISASSLTTGIIVGYSFEGHCYDLPKPKIMLIPADPLDIPPDDCGYDKKVGMGFGAAVPNYKVWVLDKLAQCIELEVNQGFVEQLILEANLPGKRSPTMYAGRMMLAHRSGRLTE